MGKYNFNFCCDCSEEVHHPVDCKTVEKWNLKTRSESEDVASTKPCPRCDAPIKKYQGCNRMICGCSLEFCWLCLGNWNGYHKCKRLAEKDGERFGYYFERWANNKASLNMAMAELIKVEEDRQREQEAAQFLIEAWKEIVSGRKVLKWTYAYGFFLPEEEIEGKVLFEYLQGQAESKLERLHYCAEKEVMGKSELSSKMKQRLSQLTLDAQNSFQNLIYALENGLSDVNFGSEFAIDDSDKESDDFVDPIYPPLVALDTLMAELLSKVEKNKNYTVVSEADLSRMMEAVISEVSSVVSLPKDETIALLCQYNWDAEQATNAWLWFADEIDVKLPESEEQREEDSRNSLRNFVEHSKCMKWCPSPGCNYAIGLSLPASNFEVTCLDNHSFCWNCLGEVHRPIDCETFSKWMSAVSDPETSNLNTILMNSKPCPNCSKPTQNYSCTGNNFDRLISCSPPCDFKFCWNCLETWESYTDIDAHRSCIEHTESIKQMETAKNYFSCYNEWADAEMSKLAAVSELEAVKLEHINVNLEKGKLDFLVVAWEEIVECRQFLKWLVVYEYYFLSGRDDDTKSQFFEFLKGQAVDALGKLQTNAEKEVWNFMLTNYKLDDLVQYQRRLVHLIRMSRSYFGSLEKEISGDMFISGI